MLSRKEVVEFWAEKLGLPQKEKTAKKRMKLRDAKKAQKQARYGDNLGGKAVEIQRKKKRDLKRIHQGID